MDVPITPIDAARNNNGVNITDTDTAVSSSNNYLILNNGRVVLIITNGAGANTVTVESTKTVDGLAVADLTASLSANKTYALGPFPPDVYNDAQGRIKVTVTAAADLLPLRFP